MSPYARISAGAGRRNATDHRYLCLPSNGHHYRYGGELKIPWDALKNRGRKRTWKEKAESNREGTSLCRWPKISRYRRDRSKNEEHEFALTNKGTLSNQPSRGFRAGDE